MTKPRTLILALLLMLVAQACAPAPVPASPAAPPGEAPAPTAMAAVTELQPPVHLKVGLFALLSMTPLVIAQDRGFFDDQGLEVELVVFETGAIAETLPALLSKQLDVMASSISTGWFSAVAQGAQVKFVADKGFLDPDDCPENGWVASHTVLETGELAEPADLAGMTVTYRPGSHDEMLLERLLARGGLTVENVRVEQVADLGVRVEALKTGTLDLTPLGEPWILRARQQGAGEVWMPYSSLAPGMSLGHIYYGPGMLERDRDVGVRFMAAYLEGVRVFREGQTAGNVQLISEFTGLSPDEVQAMCWTSFRPDGRLDTQALMEFQEWSNSKGYLDAVLPLDQVWDASYIEDAASLLSR